MTTTGSGPDAAWVPQPCALPAARRPERVAEFDTLFGTALRGVRRVEPGRLRLVLDGAVEVEAAARDLARRETECCSFFTFDFTRTDEHRLHLDVRVPDDQLDVLDTLAERATARLPAGGDEGRP